MQKNTWTMLQTHGIEICLGKDFQGDSDGAVISELLHALGFYYETKSPDADVFFQSNTNVKKEDIFITRFDPFSVLMDAKYEKYGYLFMIPGDQNFVIWTLHPQKQGLSELKKVALNLVYEPFITAKYIPKLSTETGMLYCGRNVMLSADNQCRPTATDHSCGPKNWANCPACRVIKSIMLQNSESDLKITKIDKCLAENKWQGLSGLFYCGKKYAEPFYTEQNGERRYNEGVCGIDAGIPCTDCGKELLNGYKWTQYEPS